jgi:Druantia protein DruA
MPSDEMDTAYVLRVPPTWPLRSRRALLRFARELARAPTGNGSNGCCPLPHDGDAVALAAAAHVLHDLVEQGWKVDVTPERTLMVRAPHIAADPMEEKARVRRQELLKREEQLSTPSVRRFIRDMERPREHEGRFVSVFNLMRDGAGLAVGLQAANRAGDDLRSLIDPYIQVIGGPRERCPHTGLRLVDVWRYFRHTWTNQYTSTPGRTMLVLVRDRAAEFHPIIGIAALGSAIVQISERDRWIGWRSEEFLENLEQRPDARTARWLVDRLEQGMTELHLDDLIADGLYSPTLWRTPSAEAIEALLDEAAVRRKRHHRFVRRADFKSARSAEDWRVRAESDLFRSKRCLALAELLRAKRALQGFLEPTPTARGLRAALQDRAARRAIEGIVRRAKADAVGTEIADLTVCGAVPPYSELLGGKLVSMLAVSPTIVRAYHERYRAHASEIASSLAGRPIHRRSNLVFVGTTSLYGSGSSQYNRVRIPGQVLGSRTDVVFRELGKSRSFGTSHLSRGAVAALVRLAEQSRNGARVNSIFGEGVNPKLRKVRAGIDLLDWPSDDLLQHRRRRIVYGVALVENLLPYLLGIERRPKYVFPTSRRDDVAAISAWWHTRWLAERSCSPDVLGAVVRHTHARPVRHGARVQLPPLDED